LHRRIDDFPGSIDLVAMRPTGGRIRQETQIAGVIVVLIQAQSGGLIG
jgi:hypothetical protein